MPFEFTLIRVVFLAAMSRSRMSVSPAVSPGTRLLATASNAMYRPVPEMAGSELEPLPWAPFDDTLTRVVRRERRSRTKTSVTAPFVSFDTRLEALDSYDTKRPFGVTTGSAEGPFPWWPEELTLIR